MILSMYKHNHITGLYFYYLYTNVAGVFDNKIQYIGLAIISLLLVSRMASDMPDLSHLTAEERQIIESVMLRQKQEEEREHEIMR